MKMRMFLQSVDEMISVFRRESGITATNSLQIKRMHYAAGEWFNQRESARISTDDGGPGNYADVWAIKMHRLE